MTTVRDTAIRAEKVTAFIDLFPGLSARQKKHCTDLVQSLIELHNRVPRPDEDEQREIAKSLVEVMYPRHTADVGNLDEGVLPADEKKLLDWRKSVGARIRQERTRRQWTQAELAQRIAT